MKILGLLCALLLTVLCFSVTSRAGELQIFTENYPPFNFEEKGELKGLSVEIVKEIQKRIGDDTKIVLSPWNRAYQLCQKQVDVALFSMTRTEAREKMFKWVGPLAENNWVLLAKKGSDIKPQTVNDLKAYKIGTYLNDAAEQYLKEQGLEGQIQSVNDDRLNAKKLQAGRIDLWIGGELQLPFKARQVKVDPAGFEKVMDVKKTSLYFAFNKDMDQAVVDKWQKALDEMKKDGTYDKILGKYK